VEARDDLGMNHEPTGGDARRSTDAGECLRPNERSFDLALGCALNESSLLSAIYWGVLCGNPV